MSARHDAVQFCACCFLQTCYFSVPRASAAVALAHIERRALVVLRCMTMSILSVLVLSKERAEHSAPSKHMHVRWLRRFRVVGHEEGRAPYYYFVNYPSPLHRTEIAALTIVPARFRFPLHKKRSTACTATFFG